MEKNHGWHNSPNSLQGLAFQESGMKIFVSKGPGHYKPYEPNDKYQDYYSKIVKEDKLLYNGGKCVLKTKLKSSSHFKS